MSIEFCEIFKSLIIFDQYKIISAFTKKRKMDVEAVTYRHDKDELSFQLKSHVETYKLESIISDLYSLSPFVLSEYRESFQNNTSNIKAVKNAIDIFTKKRHAYVKNYWNKVDIKYYGKKFDDAYVWTTFCNEDYKETLTSDVKVCYIYESVFGRKLDFQYNRTFTLTPEIASKYLYLNNNRTALSSKVLGYIEEIKEKQQLIKSTLDNFDLIDSIINIKTLQSSFIDTDYLNYNLKFLYYLSASGVLIYRKNAKNKFYLLNGDTPYWYDLEEKLTHDFKNEFINLLNEFIEFESDNLDYINGDEFDISFDELNKYCKLIGVKTW